jgi:hypothetical protein
MSHPTTGIGPDYWCSRWHLCTYDAFKVQAQRFVPNVLPFGDFGTDETFIGAAWAFPTSGPALVVQSGLILDGYTAPADSSGQTILQNQQQASVQDAQGATMGTLIVPGCFQVSIQMTAGGRQVENVIGLQNGSGTAAGAATATQAAWENASGPLSELSFRIGMTNYHAVDIGSSTGAIADLASATTGGKTATDLATRAASALVKWNGSSRSRSTRGRLYFGPLSESDIQSDGYSLETTRATAINAAFSVFRGSLSTSGYPLVVLSREHSIATLVTAQALLPNVVTQRRRLRA